MDKLLKRADLTISDSRRIKGEVQHSLTAARQGGARVRRLLQLARAENDRAKALMAESDLRHPGGAPKGDRPLFWLKQ